MKNIQAFLAVVNNECSVSKAADRLFLTQPAITKRINALEEQLNIKLLDRFKNKVRLTDAGQEFYKNASKLAIQWEKTRLSLDKYQKEICGTLKVLSSCYASIAVVSGVLKNYKKTYPKVQTETLVTHSFEVEAIIESLEFEIGIITCFSNYQPKLPSKQIYSEKFVVAVPKEFCDEQEIVATKFKCLSAVPRVQLCEEQLISGIWDKFYKQYSIEIDERHKKNMQLESTTSMFVIAKNFVSNGIGWALLPESMCDFNTANFIPLPEAYSLNIFAVHNGDDLLSKPAKAFLECFD